MANDILYKQRDFKQKLDRYSFTYSGVQRGLKDEYINLPQTKVDNFTFDLLLMNKQYKSAELGRNAKDDNRSYKQTYIHNY